MLKHKLKVSHLNVRSLQAHINEVRRIINDEGLDILGVTETWILPGAEVVCDIDGYDLIRRDYRGRGSGVALYIRNNLKRKIIVSSDDITNSCTGELWLF